MQTDSQSAHERYVARWQASNDRRAAKRAEEEKAMREAKIEAQRIAAQERRDKQQHKNDQSNTAQRAYYSANAAADDFARAKELNNLQQKGTLKRDDLQNRYTTQRDSNQSRDLQYRDRRLNDFSTKENEQKFGYQTMENDQQFGHQMQRDQLQHGNTMQRDNSQFGFDTRRADQTHRNTMRRDYTQHGMQLDRDQTQNQFQSERDTRLNQFDTSRDAVQQQYTVQNQYQRETAEIAAKWQEQVSQYRNAGFDFSEKQKQEMKELESSFRQNVLNSPHNLDEGVIQQAKLQHQKKLSAIIPDEKVQNQQENFEGTVVVDQETGNRYTVGRDTQGFPRYEPLAGAGYATQAQQQQAAEKKTLATQKAEFDRSEEFEAILEKLDNKVDSETGQKIYTSNEDILAEAMRQFEDRDKLYRTIHGLSPLPPYQQAEDAKRQQLEMELQGQQQQGQPRTNRYRDQLNQRQQVPKMDYSERLQNGGQNFRPTTGPQPQALSSRGPVPSHIIEELRKIPGGPDLLTMRDKYKSNSTLDQIKKEAVDIVIRSMMTGDTSDPDYARAQEILKRAGYKIGK